jgi:hypothetical protein
MSTHLDVHSPFGLHPQRERTVAGLRRSLAPVVGNDIRVSHGPNASCYCPVPYTPCFIRSLNREVGTPNTLCTDMRQLPNDVVPTTIPPHQPPTANRQARVESASPSCLFLGASALRLLDRCRSIGRDTNRAELRSWGVMIIRLIKRVCNQSARARLGQTAEPVERRNSRRRKHALENEYQYVTGPRREISSPCP